jgi:hypothetical protein
MATTSFNNWFLGANLGQRMGQHATINFNYGLQHQGAVTSCPVASCGDAGFSQTFGMTLNWHLRPTG